MLGTQRQGNRQNHEALGNVGNNVSATNLSLPLVSILFSDVFVTQTIFRPVVELEIIMGQCSSSSCCRNIVATPSRGAINY